MTVKCKLIDDCLHDLRHCNIPATQRLRLEILLFKIKLFLLKADVSRDVKVRYCSRTVLQELYHEIKALSGDEVTDVTIEAVSGHLKLIAVAISSGTAEPGSCHGGRVN